MYRFGLPCENGLVPMPRPDLCAGWGRSGKGFKSKSNCMRIARGGVCLLNLLEISLENGQKMSQRYQTFQ